jgi:NitT/TauT family transport system permease protein
VTVETQVAGEAAAGAAQPDRRRPPRSRRRRALRLTWQVVLTYAGLLGAWEVGARTGVIDEFFFPAPSRIAASLWRLTTSGEVVEHSAVTLYEMAVGLTLGSALGIGIGLLMIRSRRLWTLCQPLVYFLYSLPRIALAPLVIVMFGLGVASKIALVTFTVFFILVVNTVAGAESIGQQYVRAARALGASQRQVTWKVIVPGTVAWIFSGIRIAVSLAFLSAVVAEFVGATAGLGYRLQQAAVYFDTVQIFAWLFVLGTCSALISLVVLLLERRTLKWRPASTD